MHFSLLQDGDTSHVQKSIECSVPGQKHPTTPADLAPKAHAAY